MEKWRQSLKTAVTDIGAAVRKFELPEDDVKKAAEMFRFQVSPHYWSLIREKGDPLYLQCMPDGRELEDDGDLLDDPLGEEPDTPVPNVVHRYPDHCLFTVSDCCATYCRFCTRKRKFGQCGHIDPANLEPGFDYIARTGSIQDVLVSGGDPLLLDDENLEYILARLHAIKHVRFVRIGTRTPCMLPERITVKLTRMLKKYHPLYINVHFNHPRELAPAAVAALGRLADAGIPLGSQTVLLRGVNDDPAVMRELMCSLLAARVRPYYIFQCDLARGNSHFRTPLAAGVKIIEAMRGRTSGMAIPHFAVDLPGGGGKITLVPQYECGCGGEYRKFRNFRGQIYDYHDVK